MSHQTRERTPFKNGIHPAPAMKGLGELKGLYSCARLIESFAGRALCRLPFVVLLSFVFVACTPDESEDPGESGFVSTEEGGAQFNPQGALEPEGFDTEDGTPRESDAHDANLPDVEQDSAVGEASDGALGAGDAAEGDELDSTGGTDGLEAGDSFDAGEATDISDIMAQSDALIPDGGPSSDTSEETVDADSLEEDQDAEPEDMGEIEWAKCNQDCVIDDLECTGVCGGSPLCLAQCAAANTECKDACDAAFND